MRTAKDFEDLLFSFDWVGHFELPEEDMRWLAEELAAALRGQRNRCEACGLLHEVIVETPLGDICEKCILAFGEDAREVREAQEDL